MRAAPLRRNFLRLCLFGLLLGGGEVHSAESVSPELAQRVLTILGESEDDPTGALDKLARLVERARNDLDLSFVLTERSALLIQQDRMIEARAEMARALADRPPEFAPRLRNLYATTLLAEEDYAGALTQLEYWAAQTEAPHPHGLFLMGYACIRLERFQAAVTALERAVNSDYPTRDPWVELLAYAYTQAGRPEAALTLLQGLIKDHPEKARWWKQLAGILMLLDRVGEGTASLALADSMEPLSFTDRKRLARLFAHVGMPAEGAELLGEALERREQSPEYEEQMLLGELWMLARETDRAIATFAAAQGSAEGDVQSRAEQEGEAAMMIGQLHAQREDYAEAREALVVSVAAYGEAVPARVYYLLAVIEINLGNLKAAERAVDRLIEDEDYRERAENLAAYIGSAP